MLCGGGRCRAVGREVYRRHASRKKSGAAERGTPARRRRKGYAARGRGLLEIGDCVVRILRHVRIRLAVRQTPSERAAGLTGHHLNNPDEMTSNELIWVRRFNFRVNETVDGILSVLKVCRHLSIIVEEVEFSFGASGVYFAG